MCLCEIRCDFCLIFCHSFATWGKFRFFYFECRKYLFLKIRLISNVFAIFVKCQLMALEIFSSYYLMRFVPTKNYIALF